MTLPMKLILLLCLTGCFPSCQMAVGTTNGGGELYATYISFNHHKAHPIIFFQDGELAIRYSDFFYNNGIMWEGELETAAKPLEKRLAKEAFYQYTLPPKISRTTISFDELYSALHEDTEGDIFSPIVRVATNNSSEDFMADVRYSCYTIDEQDQVPVAYRQYVQRKAYADGLVNVPIIIRELWEFDFDGDGRKEAFISAHNFLPWSRENDPDNESHLYKAAKPEQLCSDEGIGYYWYALFYSETSLPIDFRHTSALLYDLFTPTSGREYTFSQPIYVYDKAGQPRLFELWTQEGGYEVEFLRKPLCPIICDLNNDGLYDFIALLNSSDQWVNAIYLQNTHGEFNYIGGIWGN